MINLRQRHGRCLLAILNERAFAIRSLAYDVIAFSINGTEETFVAKHVRDEIPILFEWAKTHWTQKG